jgi:ABC-2 type transport system permease protein
MRYLRLLHRFWVHSIQTDLEYRGSFGVNVVNALVGTGASLVILLAMFGHAGNVGGWTFNQAMIVMGTFTISEAFASIVLRPSLTAIAQCIELGTLDFLLIKPVSIQFVASFRIWNNWALPNLVIGIAITAYAIAIEPTISPWMTLLFLVLLISGLATLYAIWATISVVAFWIVRVSNIHSAVTAIMGAGRLPVTVYPIWLQILLATMVPVALVTHVPAAIALNLLNAWLAIPSLVISALAILLSRAAWKFAARSYTSASS